MVASETYASGVVATVDTTSRAAPKGESYHLTIKTDGKYGALKGSILNERAVGTRPKSVAPFDEAARGSLEGLREKNCALYFKYTGTPPGQSEKEACEAAFAPSERARQKDLLESTAQPERLGGNAFAQFYRLVYGKHYFHLVVEYVPQTQGHVVGATSRIR